MVLLKSVCLSVCVSSFFSVRIFICPWICVPYSCLPVFRYVCLTGCVSVCLYRIVCQSKYRYRCAYLLIYVSVYLQFCKLFFSPVLLFSLPSLFIPPKSNSQTFSPSRQIFISGFTFNFQSPILSFSQPSITPLVSWFLLSPNPLLLLRCRTFAVLQSSLSLLSTLPPSGNVVFQSFLSTPFPIFFNLSLFPAFLLL